MERMLGRTRPFYKAGPVMRLQKIPADRFAEFIEARFRATKLRPAPGLGASIVELAGNLPYDVQRLAHEVWDDVRGGKTVGLEDLHDTLKRLLGEHEAHLRRHVAAAHARAARARSAPPCSRKAVSCCRPTSAHVTGSAAPSTVQASLTALVREDVLAREGARYVVVDSLFREWVARHTH